MSMCFSKGGRRHRVNDLACPCDEAPHWFLSTWGQQNACSPKFAFNIRLRTLDVLIFPRLCSFVLGSASVWPEGDKGLRFLALSFLSGQHRLCLLPWSLLLAFPGSALLTVWISAASAGCGPLPIPHSLFLSFFCCFLSILLNFPPWNVCVEAGVTDASPGAQQFLSLLLECNQILIWGGQLLAIWLLVKCFLLVMATCISPKQSFLLNPI